MAKRTGGGLLNMSTAELQRELARRSRKAGTIQKRRAKLMARVAKLDELIRLHGGTPAGAARRGRPPGSGRRVGGGGKRTRPSNKLTLVESLAGLLKGKTMAVNDITRAVQDAGYKTNAANFRTIVNQCLINNRKSFRKVSRGKYTAA